MADPEGLKSILQRGGVAFGPGLALHEVRKIEATYDFRFPPDYRDFLMHALPASDDFINWRATDQAQILKAISWPYRGLCFDVEHSAFWLKDWGPRPLELSEAFAIVRDALSRAPKLVPIFSHRYIPDAPLEPGNPVLSVYQADIIYYGRDLPEYFENEFSVQIFGERRYQITEPVKRIPFWSYLVDANNGLVDDGTSRRPSAA